MSGEEHKWNKQKQRARLMNESKARLAYHRKKKSNLSYGEDFPFLITWNTNRGFRLSIFISNSGILSTIPFQALVLSHSTPQCQELTERVCSHFMYWLLWFSYCFLIVYVFWFHCSCEQAASFWDMHFSRQWEKSRKLGGNSRFLQNLLPVGSIKPADLTGQSMPGGHSQQWWEWKCPFP